MDYIWVTNGSQISYTLVTLRIQCFSSSSLNSPNFDPIATLVTFRIRKMNVIFDQSEESNPTKSLTNYPFLTCHKLVFCTSGSGDNSLCLAFIGWVGNEEERGHQHEKRALNTSLWRHPKPFARPWHRYSHRGFPVLESATWFSSTSTSTNLVQGAATNQISDIKAGAHFPELQLRSEHKWR